MDPQIIKQKFTYHSPDKTQISNFETLRNRGKDLADTINVCVPDSEEKSIAINKLSEVIMWANAGIARNE